MTAARTRTFDNQEAGIEIAAVLVENVPVRQSEEDEIEQEVDLWFLFVSIMGNDSWFSYAITDTMEGEPTKSIERGNITELKKLSILIGDSWDEVEKDYQQVSIRHRRTLGDLDEETKSVMLEMSFSELIERRQKIDFESIRAHWRKFPMVLSLN